MNNNPSSTEPIVIDCPKCKGRGFLERTSPKQAIGKRCPRCKGVGKVETTGDSTPQSVLPEAAVPEGCSPGASREVRFTPKPMETAPKDRDIWLYIASLRIWQHGRWSDAFEQWFTGYESITEATHWTEVASMAPTLKLLDDIERIVTCDSDQRRAILTLLAHRAQSAPQQPATAEPALLTPSPPDCIRQIERLMDSHEQNGPDVRKSGNVQSDAEHLAEIEGMRLAVSALKAVAWEVDVEAERREFEAAMAARYPVEWLVRNVDGPECDDYQESVQVAWDMWLSRAGGEK